MTTRREVLKGIIVSIGGATLLHACGGNVSIAPSGYGQPLRFYRQRELAMISRLADLIIPRTETPGALDAKVPGLLDSLMADWANSQTQATHRAAIEALYDELGEDFPALPASAATDILRRYDARAFANGAQHNDYKALKRLITQAYFATEEGALQEQGWVAVPGRWDPCAELPA
jgi:hypothetical protein